MADDTKLYKKKNVEGNISHELHSKNIFGATSMIHLLKRRRAHAKDTEASVGRRARGPLVTSGARIAHQPQKASNDTLPNRLQLPPIMQYITWQRRDRPMLHCSRPLLLFSA
ncbi:hypothetical protein AVEN_21441-1 [Araneus ventricosus]|uniref:Uncharacterized protein n=1 Tax=Araneus ventricosus TaxID=182803 RepID=A0A4Y2KEF2_ARAVE|nr:hypothetical protein AVEN_21441-1 [Araneus ventricosus]